MVSKCNKCGIDIEWKQDGNKNVPYTLSGARHSYKDCPRATDKPVTEERKPVSKQTRWEGIKTVKEVRIHEVNDYLLNGWVILDRVERMTFVEVPFNAESDRQSTAPLTKTLQTITESIFVIGVRA